MLDELLLLSGSDIPFPQARINIHQPTIKEISYIGEENFFLGCELLKFSKDILSDEDKKNLKDKNDFEVLLSIIRNNKSISAQKSKISVNMVLTLLFPDYQFNMLSDAIAFKKIGTNEEVGKIDKDNFSEFKEILSQMFCLSNTKQGNYNPANKLAQEFADKMRKGREKAAQQKGEHHKIAVLSRYISILSVGECKDMNCLLNYTIYQLYDEFERFEAREAYDLYIKQKLAGAKDLQDIDNWMRDLHP